MTLVTQLIVGGVVGWLASIVMKTNAQMGAVANVVVGVVGSAIGSAIAAGAGLTGGAVAHWLFSIGGAVLLIVVLKALGLFR